MKRVLSSGLLLVLFSLSVLAGGYFMNDTGETVYGLRIVFSEPVTITSFGDVLMSVEPSGESTTFMFSGGTVEPWGDHWIIWEPGSASVVSEEWQKDVSTYSTDTSAAASVILPWGADPTGLDFRYLCIGQTCHEIFLDFPDDPRAVIMPILEDIKSLGFKGVSANFTYFLDTEKHLVYPCYTQGACCQGCSQWRFSPQDWMIEVLFECIRDAGLDGDLRLEAVVPNVPE